MVVIFIPYVGLSDHEIEPLNRCGLPMISAAALDVQRHEDRLDLPHFELGGVANQMG
ncbi:hypothetical protein [Deefgea salmonis]|uniref:Uncharacterized protein n=1 Tax=Deefgea salmonis TaxID=2875502 RepID=A0ABS8BLT6_9NEIS|nr:hypothetical protein [Deefgea salmonis]MCB5196690.1 hypothetical protein [Deefgea salmonis]